MGVTAVCEVVFRSVQILLLIVFHQYIIFLLLWIAEKATSNTICAFYVNKRHPYLKRNHTALSNDKKQAIFNTVKPLVVNQTANTVLHSAKSILISLLLGNISIVGYYGNYQLVISMVEMIYTQFGGAFTTSFGNLAVENDEKRMATAYKKAAFVMDWFACIMCAGFYVCIQDFIMITFGQTFVLNSISVISLTLNLVFYLVNIPVISIQNAMGLHRLDAFFMIIQAVSSIFLGYIGGLLFAMPGIFFGLLIPLIIFTTIRKGFVVTKEAFGMKSIDYLKFIGFELFKVVLTIAIASLICSRLSMQASIFSFIIKGFIAVLLGFMLPAILSFRSNEFKYACSLTHKYASRLLRKKR
ncbi:MAG: hypothetical protein J5517_10625 [Eubacterium sp.]|nr:hypothetical protein [Eubacterium sp.]